MLNETLQRDADSWLAPPAPQDHIVVSSRARYARNLSGFSFAPHSRPEVHGEVLRRAAEAITTLELTAAYQPLLMMELRPPERIFLRESRLISPDMERKPAGRAAFISPDRRVSIMINEEDHLRIQCLAAGFRLGETFQTLDKIESALSARLRFAFSERLGFLTACPTNTGTGLRVSVMLHLPALSTLKKMEDLFQGVAPYGVTVRGFYGENTEFQGDFFQFSNEITLGKAEEEICTVLEKVIELVIEREEQAREELIERHRLMAEDLFWRSWALLTNARTMNSLEALQHLSRIRLGIETGWTPAALSHHDLNRLVMETQPAHLQIAFGNGAEMSAETRDELRARLLRQRLSPSAPASPAAL